MRFRDFFQVCVLMLLFTCVRWLMNELEMLHFPALSVQKGKEMNVGSANVLSDEVADLKAIAFLQEQKQNLSIKISKMKRNDLSVWSDVNQDNDQNRRKEITALSNEVADLKTIVFLQEQKQNLSMNILKSKRNNSVVSTPSENIDEKRWSYQYKSVGIDILAGGKVAFVHEASGGTLGGTHGYRHVAIIGNSKFRSGKIDVSVKTVFTKNCFNYLLGILSDLPKDYQEGFGKLNKDLLAWGFHDRDVGIWSQTQLVAKSSCGFKSGDTVTMEVDVDMGFLKFSVNGRRCAEHVDERIKEGVYLGAMLDDPLAVFTILSENEI